MVANLIPVVARPLEGEPFICAADAARFLRLSRGHLLRLVRQGSVPAYAQGDGCRKRWLFRISELDAWMRSRAHSSCHPCHT